MSWTLSAFADEAGGSCEEQIAALQQAGLKHIDIRSMDGYNISQMPIEHAQQVKTKLDAAGITVQMFGSPLGKIDIADDPQSDYDKLRHMAELAKIFDCPNVRIFSYYNKENRPKAEWQAESLKRLQQLRDIAEETGLVLYHENERHIFGDLGADVRTIADELRDGKHFRVIFDFDNYNQSGEDVPALWQQLHDVTDGIHLKDSTAENQHVPVGQGNGHVPEIIADAVQRGWTGVLAVEPHLQHSKAVAATGPSGEANQQFANMTSNECFQVACEAAKTVLAQAGAKWE
jgi:sugar phosphate isomerase/epimerase